MKADAPDDGLAAALIQISAHAERISGLDAREASHYQAIPARLPELPDQAASPTPHASAPPCRRGTSAPRPSARLRRGGCPARPAAAAAPPAAATLPHPAPPSPRPRSPPIRPTQRTRRTGPRRPRLSWSTGLAKGLPIGAKAGLPNGPSARQQRAVR